MFSSSFFHEKLQFFIHFVRETSLPLMKENRKSIFLPNFSFHSIPNNEKSIFHCHSSFPCMFSMVPNMVLNFPFSIPLPFLSELS